MLVPLEGYQQAWQRIKQESMSHSTYRVVMFVSSMDVDAFAAAGMLSALLKKHLILYKTEPVVGYHSLKSRFQRLDPSIRNVFLVGCGSSVDLEEFLQLEDLESSTRPKPRIHVFDRARPWHLNNLYGNDLVYCYDDGDVAQLEPFREAYMALATQDDGSDGSDIEEAERIDSATNSGAEERLDSDAEVNSDDESSRTSRAVLDRRRRAITDDDDDEVVGSDHAEETQEDDEQLENAASEPASKRRRTQRTRNVRLLEGYYRQGSYISVTNAVAVYTLLTLIGETSSSMLWFAIIGVTAIEAQYPQLYRLLLPSLQDEMRRLNQTESHNHEGSAAKSRGIRFYAEADYSLFLLRQWSIYESMMHSSYVSAKLFLWREDGRKKLHKMLARVGITLQDAKESWIHTKPSLKRELRGKLESVSSYYGIEGISRDGVVRQFGLAGSMSAGDCVESLAAFLETGKHSQDARVPAPDGPEDAELAEEALHEAWVRNFWTAWDAFNNYDRLCVGAEQAKALQRAVVATANFIFDKNLPKDLHSFRMVIVQEAPDIDVFLNPLSLQRLAVWISEGCAEIHTSNIPLVLAVLNEARNAYLVFGMAGHRTRDQDSDLSADNAMQNNFFGQQFQDTALKINARIRIDAFDSSIIEVLREDLPRFLEALDSQIRISA